MLFPDSLSKPGVANWISQMAYATAPGLLVIGTYWAAVTFGWLIALTAPRLESPRDLTHTGIVWCVLLSPVVWATVRFGGWEWAGFAALVWLIPVAHFALSLQAEAEKVMPSYSRAVAKMKFGKYNEAEIEVIRELEDFEEDFDGWMMLAELYANHFHDLAEAERTIRGLASQPGTNATQFAIAFHRLADWHLKPGDDPVAARRALEEICKKMPGTHLDKMARLRINQLPATAKELREQRKGRAIRLPPPVRSLGELVAAAKAPVSDEKALARANQCVELLRRDPNDVPVREELAKIFAEQLGKIDLALEQMELIIGMAEQPPEKIAECLSSMAAWEMNFRHDREAARKYLDRLVQEHSRTPQAFEAQRQIHLMDMEARFRKARAGAGKVASGL
jgi:tetratricopeptide (TPR) repeat protein